MKYIMGAEISREIQETDVSVLIKAAPAPLICKERNNYRDLTICPSDTGRRGSGEISQYPLFYDIHT